MNEASVTYPPLDTPKEVADGIWIVDSVMNAMGFMPIPVRMTVIRLAQGGLLLHSPIRYDAALHAALEAIAPVRFLLAPDTAHWMFVKDWQEHCPQALCWAAPGLPRRGQVRRSGIRIDGEIGPGMPTPWADEIDQVVVEGVWFVEVVLHHRASRTVILTDLVQNFEPGKIPALLRPFARLTGVTAPDGRAPVYLRAMVKAGGRRAADAARRVIDFAPERVIFSHGRWFDADGTARLQRSLRWLAGSAAP